jgi:hypothetical protein
VSIFFRISRFPMSGPPSNPFAYPDNLSAPTADMEFYDHNIHNDPIFGGDPPSQSSPWKTPSTTTSTPGPTPPRPAVVQDSQSSAPAVAHSSAFWTVGFWQQFFNVDTVDVERRILSSFWPLQPPDYLVAKKLGILALLESQDLQAVTVPGSEPPDLEAAPTPGNPHPDLYGPLWVCCTLWLLIAVVAQVIQGLNCRAVTKDASCQKSWFAFVAAAGGVLATYQIAVPVGMWTITRWQGAPIGLLDTVCLYGYALCPIIPAVFLCAVPWALFQWTALMLAFALSALHIVCNFYGVWKRCLPPNWFGVVLVGSLALHAILCLTLKWEFFWTLHPSAAAIPNVTTTISAAP